MEMSIVIVWTKPHFSLRATKWPVGRHLYSSAMCRIVRQCVRHCACLFLFVRSSIIPRGAATANLGALYLDTWCSAHITHNTIHTCGYTMHITPCCIWWHDTAHTHICYEIQRAHCALQSTQPQWIINWSLSPPRLTSYHYVWQARVTAHVTEYSELLQKLHKTQNCSKTWNCF